MGGPQAPAPPEHTHPVPSTVGTQMPGGSNPHGCPHTAQPCPGMPGVTVGVTVGVLDGVGEGPVT
jgi:hypothetical protein